MVGILKKLTDAYGPSGIEDQIREIIKYEFSGMNITTDVMGNLILHIPGDGEKIMFAAHMDEVGVMVTHIDENGFLRFTNIGAVTPYTLYNSRVVFENKTVGIISTSSKTDMSKLSFSDMFIDVAGDGDIKVGDCAIFENSFIVREETVAAKSLDDRIGVCVLIEVIKRYKKTNNDLYFVFTTQEEVGLKGVGPAAFSINPKYAVAVDVTPACDVPDGEKLPVKLGLGAAIKIKDQNIIAHPIIKEKLKEAAIKTNSMFQYEIIEKGSTDGGVILSSREGVVCGVLSIPIRYVHTPCETININDVKSAIDILSDFAYTDI